MALQGIKSGFAFSRNPIIVQTSYPSDAYDKRGGSFFLMLDGTNIYEGRFSPPLKIDLSEIIDAFVTPFLDATELDSSAPLVLIEDESDLSCRTVLASFECGGYEDEYEFTVIPGGISKQNYRRLYNRGQDVFSTRFFNWKCNFFLTTRTAGWRIIIKETELSPLYFFVRRQDEEVAVTEMITKQTISFERLSPGVYALNIDALRRQFMEQYSVIPNIFDVYMAGAFSCRIVVERSDISKERYRLKFRNSLGVFEIIELTGELSISPEYDDSDDAIFKRRDYVTGDYYSDRERIERRQSVNVETGVKRPDEIRFLMDMIASEEVYLLDITLFPVKVIPSIEDFKYRLRPEVPEKFTLKLEIAESETNIMQDIIDGSEGRKPRVFSKQFSKHFN